MFPGAFPTRPSDSLGVGELPGPALDERRRRRPGKGCRRAAGSRFPPNPVGRACRSPRCSLRDRPASRDCLLGPGVSGSLHAGSRAEDSRPSSASPGLALSLRSHIPESPGRGLPSADCPFSWLCATPEAQPPNPEPPNSRTPTRTHPWILGSGRIPDLALPARGLAPKRKKAALMFGVLLLKSKKQTDR